MAKEISYEVKKKLGKLSDKLELRIVAWGEREAKLDIRQWYEDRDGNEKCSKGVCLTTDEAKQLVDLLTNFFDDEDDDF